MHSFWSVDERLVFKGGNSNGVEKLMMNRLISDRGDTFFLLGGLKDSFQRWY